MIHNKSPITVFSTVLIANLQRVPSLLPSKRSEEQTRQAYKMLSDCFRFYSSFSICASLFLSRLYILSHLFFFFRKLPLRMYLYGRLFAFLADMGWILLAVGLKSLWSTLERNSPTRSVSCMCGFLSQFQFFDIRVSFLDSKTLLCLTSNM